MTHPLEKLHYYSFILFAKRGLANCQKLKNYKIVRNENDAETN